jgi:chemotaxis protein methyltransferase CheR
MPSPASNVSLLSPTQYRSFVAMVYELTRINLGPEKQELVAARLSKRLRRLNLPSYDAYFALLEGPGRAEELPHLIDVISTHHTYFYREERHFEYLRDHIVPELRAKVTGRPWRFWSAACSTGEEPATLAIALAESGAAPKQWEIHCSDIAPNTVQTASRMVFKRSALQKLPPTWRQKYFQLGVNQWREHCRLIPSLRQSFAFEIVNLAEDYGWPQPFDVIFLRNVMIYFDRPTQVEVLTRALRYLRPQGYLITGQSESLAGIRLPLRTVASSIYQFVP